MIMKRLNPFVLMIAPFIVFVIWGFQQNRHRHRWGQQHVVERNIKNTDLPYGYNTLFAASGECLMCHENISDSQGNNVGILGDWRSTMMANSAKDPLWQAKVSHEVLVNPGLQSAIEDKCTRCHAPAANYDAHHNGGIYSLSDMDTSSMGLDGINCSVCHQIKPESMGNFSGDFLIGEQHNFWGPYENPFYNPMFNHTGYTASYSSHIKKSELCASCHTLITHSVDYSGTPTGNSFVEQSIYQEWLNSSYPSNGSDCQSCHMPEVSDPVVISAMPPWFNDTRSPFGLHHFVGANVFMLQLLKDNSAPLGITATQEQLDSTISRTQHLIQNFSISMQVEEVNRTVDSLFIDVDLKNITGHKFPTGFPSRRAFLELIVSTMAGDTVFHSGKFDEDFNLLDENTGFEPHYNIINSESQVQIYEMVMADFQGNQTTVLLYADSLLKDNRLVPNGFSIYHNSYDTVKIVGEANNDPDYNFENGIEGSGGDIVHFHIPTFNNINDLKISVNLHYQTVNDKWLADMFSFSSTRIDTFKHMYQSADRTPVLVAEASLTSSIEGIEENFGNSELLIFPNPASEYLSINCKSPIVQINWYNSEGKLIHSASTPERYGNQYKIPVQSSGLFYIEVSTKDDKFLHKVVLM